MTTFSAKAPVAMVVRFRKWADAVGLRMQDATAVALWSVMQLDGSQRDAMMVSMRQWLAESEGAVPLPDGAMAAIEEAQAKAAAARQTLRAEAERKRRADKKTG